MARSSAYYTPLEVSPQDLALMRRIDELHLEHPFAGARMLRDLLRAEGHPIWRKHVDTYLRFYNERRPHRTHGGRTPDQAYFGSLADQAPLAA